MQATERPAPHTPHTNLYNRPDFVLSNTDPRWCHVCGCWDLGLIETANGNHYTHIDH